MTEQWLLWRDGVHDPWFNMSVDELLLEGLRLIYEKNH